MFSAIKRTVIIWLQRNKEAVISPLQPSLLELVDHAKEEWHRAQEYFEYVKEGDLVDYAIIKLEGAEKKYNYLLRQLREH